jgi:hypothetical protein
MKKYRSEIAEMLHEEYLADLRHGFITEAELREFEKDCFIDEDETPREKSLVTEHESI